MPTINPALEALIRKVEQKLKGSHSAVIIEVTFLGAVCQDSNSSIYKDKLSAINQIVKSSNSTSQPLMVSVDMSQNIAFFAINPARLLNFISRQSCPPDLTEQLLYECSDFCYRKLNKGDWKITFHNLP